MTTWRKPNDVINQIREEQHTSRLHRRTQSWDPDDKPGPPSNVALTIKVQEILNHLEYRGIVSFDPPTVGACAADVKYYAVELRAVNQQGTVRRGSKRRTTIDGDLTDDGSLGRAVFLRLEHPKKWYWQTRVRAVDRALHKGTWSAWTAPQLPLQSSLPKPPTPTGVAVFFDREESNRHSPWRARVICDEIGNWDVPGPEYDDEADFVPDDVDITADTITTPTHGLENNIPIIFRNRGGNLPPPLVAGTIYYVRDRTTNTFKVAGSPGGAAINITGKGTGDHTWTANLPPGLENDVAYYKFQLRRTDSNGVPINTDGNWRTKTIPARDDDAGAVARAVFKGLRKRAYYQARVRSVDRYHRRGDWSAWTPAARASDNQPPPLPTNVLLFMRRRQAHIEWDLPLDTEDTDAIEPESHPDIAYSQVQLATDAAFNNVIRKDRYVSATKKNFRIKRADLSANNFYVRVRTVDGAGNKSAWVSTALGRVGNPVPAPATLAFQLADAGAEGSGDTLQAQVLFPAATPIDENADDIRGYLVQLQYAKQVQYGLDVDGGTTAIDVATDEIIKTNHRLVIGDAVRFFVTDNAVMPGGLVLGTTYYVVNVSNINRFKVSITPGGSVVNITSQGSGQNRWFARAKQSGAKRPRYVLHKDIGDPTDNTVADPYMATFHNISEKAFYRARIRVDDREGRFSLWSGWTPLIRAAIENTATSDPDPQPPPPPPPTGGTTRVEGSSLTGILGTEVVSGTNLRVNAVGEGGRFLETPGAWSLTLLARIVPIEVDASKTYTFVLRIRRMSDSVVVATTTVSKTSSTKSGMEGFGLSLVFTTVAAVQYRYEVEMTGIGGATRKRFDIDYIDVTKA